MSQKAKTPFCFPKLLACEMEWFLPGKMDFPEGSTSFLTDLSELLWRALFVVMARFRTQAVIAHRRVS